MKILMNGKECEVEPGIKMTALVKIFEDTVASDPMIQNLKEKTGESKLVFILNGRVIRADEFDSIEIKEGDQVRMIHPFFGG